MWSTTLADSRIKVRGKKMNRTSSAFLSQEIIKSKQQQQKKKKKTYNVVMWSYIPYSGTYFIRTYASCFFVTLIPCHGVISQTRLPIWKVESVCVPLQPNLNWSHAVLFDQGADWRRPCAAATWRKLPEFHQPSWAWRTEDGGAHCWEGPIVQGRSYIWGERLHAAQSDSFVIKKLW